MARSRSRKLTRLERLMVDLVNGLARWIMGSANSRVHEEAVRTLGIRGTWRWMTTAGRLLEVLGAHVGPANAQFIVGFAGLWYGCGFCGTGHIHGGNLLVFRDDGVLTPLDDATLRELYDTPDARALLRIQELLAEPRYDRLRGLIVRLFELRRGAPPTGADDRLLVAALACWEWVTECTIVVGVDIAFESVPPPVAAYKDRRLYDRYDAARAAAAATAATAEPDKG